jgi:hypothetical protein
MTDQPIGKYTTTLDMLMHHHPWLAEMLQWKLIENFSMPKDSIESKPFLGFREHEAPAVFQAYRYPHPTYDKIGYSIFHDSEGLSNYTPTHYLPLPELPGKSGWKNFEGPTP